MDLALLSSRLGEPKDAEPEGTLAFEPDEVVEAFHDVRRKWERGTIASRVGELYWVNIVPSKGPKATRLLTNEELRPRRHDVEPYSRGGDRAESSAVPGSMQGMPGMPWGGGFGLFGLQMPKMPQMPQMPKVVMLP